MRRLIAIAYTLTAVGLSAVALASPDETVTFNEPQPGGTITAASQPINDAKKVIVGVKGDLAKTTVVVDGGAHKAAGDAVAACWLAGPGAIPVNNKRIKDILENDPDIQAAHRNASPQLAIRLCMELVAVVGTHLTQRPQQPPRAVAAGSRCQATPINLRFTRRDGKKVVTLAKRKAGPKVRYRCRTVAGGIDLTATDTRGRALSGSLGPKLDVGLYKTTDGPPSSGRMSLRYRLR